MKLNFLKLYLLKIFLPLIVISVVVIISLYSFLFPSPSSVVDAEGFGVFLYIILIPTNLGLINIAVHVILGKKFLKGITNEKERGHNQRLIIFNSAILFFVFSILPYLIIFIAFSYLSSSDSIMKPRREKYLNVVKLDNFKKEIVWKDVKDPYARLIITADVNTAQPDTYYFVNTKMLCNTTLSKENYKLLINGNLPDSNGWPGIKSFKEVYPIELPQGKSFINFEVIFSKIDGFYINDKNSIVLCDLYYNIYKRGQIEEIKLGRPAVINNYAYDVAIYKQWDMPKFPLRELINK